MTTEIDQAYVAALEEALFEACCIGLACVGTYGKRDANGLCGPSRTRYDRLCALQDVNRRRDEIWKRNGEQEAARQSLGKGDSRG